MDAKVYITIKELLEQRGYVNIRDDGDVTIADSPILGKICVFYNTCAKFNVDRTEEYMKMLHDMKITHAIVVYKSTVTPMAKRVLEKSTDYTFELFTEPEMKYNITKHRLVPKHTLLTHREVVEFKNAYGLNIPTLLKTDPVARFYAYKRGDIVRIDRPDGICFRVVK